MVASLQLGDVEEIELHATDVYGGRGAPWKHIKTRSPREKIIYDVIDIVNSQPGSVRLFSVVIEKEGISPADPIEAAFEQICNRFNLYLERDNYRNRRRNKGLIVMDRSRHEKPLQALARDFRINGATWGNFRNLAEVPLFADSTATRLIQIADLVAWATFRRYEFQDGRFFDKLIPKFDADGGVIHGLYHHRGPERNERCFCPACMTREQKVSG